MVFSSILQSRARLQSHRQHVNDSQAYSKLSKRGQSKAAQPICYCVLVLSGANLIRNGGQDVALSTSSEAPFHPTSVPPPPISRSSETVTLMSPIQRHPTRWKGSTDSSKEQFQESCTISPGCVGLLLNARSPPRQPIDAQCPSPSGRSGS